METFTMLVTNFGGMGVCVGIVVYFAKYALDNLTPLIDDFRKSLDANTQVIIRLEEKLTNHIDSEEK